MMNGLIMKYFVLKPAGDSVYAAASRKALRAYAKHIEQENEELAVDLYNWAHDESPIVIDAQQQDTVEDE